MCKEPAEQCSSDPCKRKEEDQRKSEKRCSDSKKQFQETFGQAEGSPPRKFSTGEVLS